MLKSWRLGRAFLGWPFLAFRVKWNLLKPIYLDFGVMGHDAVTYLGSGASCARLCIGVYYKLYPKLGKLGE